MWMPSEDRDSEAEDEEMFGHLDGWEVPYDYLQRVSRRRNQRETEREVFGSPSKRRRLQKLAKAAVEEEKLHGVMKCVCVNGAHMKCVMKSLE